MKNLTNGKKGLKKKNVVDNKNMQRAVARRNLNVVNPRLVQKGMKKKYDVDSKNVQRIMTGRI